MINSSTANRARVAVQIGGSWYATDTVFSSTQTGSAANFAGLAGLGALGLVATRRRR